MRSKIKSELHKIAQLHRGLLRPQDVVDYARDPETALHDQFEWDDAAGAEKYRLWQARQIIRVKVRVLAPGMPTTRAYVSLLRDRRREGGGYRAIARVLGDSARRQEMLDAALDELRVLRAKYAILKELAGVWAAMDAAERRSIARAG